MKPSPITDWFQRKYHEPTPAQSAAWPLIEAGRNALIVSPTGTGKTFAAFLSVLNELALLHASSGLQNTIYAIYISPLRALSYDLEKNLNQPLHEIYGEKSPIRVGLRSGDTTQSERQKQFTRAPHILLTTPESLALLLSQEKWLPHLRSVRWLIVDEIHALAENKRGAHLSISLERLDSLRGSLVASSDPAMRGVIRAVDLSRARDGRRIRVAGSVITRQRPGTAKGFVFLTLEDETGIANVIVRPDLFDRDRLTILDQPFLLVDGILQNQDGVMSVKAERLHALGGVAVEIDSHDFH